MIEESHFETFLYISKDKYQIFVQDKNDFLNNQLPFIFGNPDVIEFFYIKEIIDKSKISY